MAFPYSKNLIEETIACFLEEDGVVLTENEACEALDGLSGLFLAFSRPSVGARPQKAGRTPEAPDLITPHSCKDK